MHASLQIHPAIKVLEQGVGPFLEYKSYERGDFSNVDAWDLRDEGYDGYFCVGDPTLKYH
jgi:hypothetical protein